MRIGPSIYALVLGSAMAVYSVTAIADVSREVLWAALRTCVIAKKTVGEPFPCLAVDLGDKDRPGTAVLRAPGQPTQVIVMPIEKVAGIESPELQHRLGNVLWRNALAKRHVVSDALKGSVPIENVGMAVNSLGGRSQDQLHIHLDCIDPLVSTVIQSRMQHVQDSWVTLTPNLHGSKFSAIRIKSSDVEDFNPFAALALMPGRRTGLKEVSFAAFSTAPSDPEKGFFLLAYRSRGSHAEKLLDHTCSARSTTAAR